MTASVGLDLSLTGTGLVGLSKVPGCKDVEELFSECLVPDTGADRFAKVKGVADHILSRIRCLENPIITIEGYGQGAHKGVASFVKLVEVGTAVRMGLWELGLSWAEVPPQSLKKFVTGSGVKVDKKRMIHGCSEVWGFETDNHNIADAYGLARFGLARGGLVPCEPWQVDVMERVKSG